MAEVRYAAATRHYPGTERPAVSSLNLDITDGELLVLVGPSGSGKSTALRMLAGLEAVDEGSIWIGDRDVTLVAPQDRDIAMVFQNYALYPQMSVAANMGFALKQAGVDKDERARRVQEAARVLGLEEYLDRKPKNLSGGQRQRVAMGRAIVREPQVFLMDEPLSNLDAKLRVQTRMELADLQARLAVTTVYVTHDQVEAMTMGHRVGVLKDGLLQQCDTPRQLYRFPTNVFVAGFIGSPAMNLVDTVVDGERLSLGTHDLPVDDGVRAWLRGGRGTGKVTVGVRPEGFQIGSDGLPGEVITVEELGSEAYVHVLVEHRGESRPLIVRTDGDTMVSRGDRLHLEVAGPVHVFDDLGNRIGGGVRR